MTKTFVLAMKDFFGVKPGETIRDFAAELKALTYEDKMEFAMGLRKMGLDCDDPAKVQ